MIERAYGELFDAGLSRRTIRSAHTVLHGALAKAVKWGFIGRNPVDAVTPPSPERSEMKTLSEEQIRGAVCREHR
jgi:hypothetical protein